MIENDSFFYTFGKNVAGDVKVSHIKPVNKLEAEVRGSLRMIQETYKKALEDAQKGNRLLVPYEWIYDNYHIAAKAAKMALMQMAATKRLPAVSEGERRGFPAIYVYTRLYLKGNSCRFEEDSMAQFLSGVQEIKEIKSEELWNLSVICRAALISLLGEVCDEVLNGEGANPENAQNSARYIENIIKSLRELSTYEFDDLYKKASVVEKLLLADPSGIYGNMSESSKSIYRYKICEMAKKLRLPESKIAREALEQAQKGKDERSRHIGTYILKEKKENRLKGSVYIFLLVLLPFLLSAWTYGYCDDLVLSVLLYFPYFEICKIIIEYFAAKLVPVFGLPRLDLKEGIPDNAKTLVVISVLITSAGKIADFKNKLERFYYSNRDKNITFGILADFKDSAAPESDSDSMLKETLINTFNAMNQQYQNEPFALFLRSRVYSKTENKYMGWERKRGAIAELLRFIKGEGTTIDTFVGNKANISKVRYVVTVDSDTNLRIDSVRQLVFTMLHPLNHAVIDNKKGIVTDGYGILQPRVDTDINSAQKTRFAKIMAGLGGIDTYDNASFDIYQSLFGEGNFCGKGILDVDVCHKVLDNTLPEGRILSHDIIEGCCVRTGIAGDIELTDSFPSTPSAYFDRNHRWIRGDIQNLAFIFKKGKVYFSPLSKWKIADNARRELTPAISVIALIWCILSG
ncbi:MAG: hypothetical protein Q8865_07090, partial [Bacillota bacterium]|nr:hypothetical protein [Bacillota bacterium]